MMTRKDFRLWADVIKRLPLKDRERKAMEIAKLCQDSNGRFRLKTFLKARGVKKLCTQ
jgi:hypothetical protein